MSRSLRTTSAASTGASGISPSTVARIRHLSRRKKNSRKNVTSSVIANSTPLVSTPWRPLETLPPPCASCPLLSSSRSMYSRTGASHSILSSARFQRSPSTSRWNASALAAASWDTSRTSSAVGSAITTVTITSASAAATPGQRSRARMRSCSGCAITASTTAQVSAGTNGSTIRQHSHAVSAVAMTRMITSIRSRVRKSSRRCPFIAAPVAPVADCTLCRIRPARKGRARGRRRRTRARPRPAVRDMRARDR